MPAPGQFLPRASFAHRIACKALYRALLIHVPKISLPDELRASFRGPVNPIKHLIRKRFRKNVALESKVQIVESLTQGYALEETLRAATAGIQPALSHIHTHLQLTAERAAHSRTVCAKPPPRQKHRVWEYPGAPKLLDIRPLPLSQISSGRRHVPTLTQTTNIPFLRFKKPQSQFLARILRDKLKWKEKKMKYVEDCEAGITLGEWQGQWELTVLRQMEKDGCLGVESRSARVEEDDIEIDDEKLRWWMGGVGQAWGEGGWQHAYSTEKANLWTLIRADGAKDVTMGEKLLDIVQQERALWATERAERLAKKEQERMEKKTAVSLGDGTEDKTGEPEPEYKIPQPLVKATKDWKPAEQPSKQIQEQEPLKTFTALRPPLPGTNQSKATSHGKQPGEKPVWNKKRPAAKPEWHNSHVKDDFSMHSTIVTEKRDTSK